MFEFFDDGMADSPAYAQDGPYIPDANECLRCGVCIGSCPTYKINPVAEETPRSRIRTIDKIIKQNIAVSGQELQHLDNCTQCRACEAVCPSRMAYGQLFDQARAQLGNKTDTLWAAIGFKLIGHKAWLSAAATLINVYQNSGLQFLARKSGLLPLLGLDKAEALMPKAATGRLAKIYPGSKPNRGCVGLFTGCLGNHFDRQTLLASISLLNAIGYDVLVPDRQTCCGAIHQHQGQPDTAELMAAANLAVFNKLPIDGIIYTASGCGLMLGEYRQAFTHRLFDISEFLNLHWPDTLHLQARPGTVAVHEPCSQRNSLKNQQHVYGLLGKIPGLSPLPLPENHICCGAGGVHMLTHPHIAEPLRDAKLAHFAQSGATLLVTGNIGCALHLNTGLARNKLVHPVVLLAAQLN